jgi:exopolysaccharide biosynthesis polyprenyl glycosylphosphotransferase
MRYFRRRVLLNSFKLADLLILVLSFGIATLAVLSGTTMDLESFFAMRISLVNMLLFLGLMLCWHLLFASLGLYYSMRLSSRWSEVIEIVKATSLATVVIFVTAKLFHMVMITPLFLVVFWAASTLLTVITRFILRLFLGRVRVSGRNLRHVLLAGTNERAAGFAEIINSKPHLGYIITGFVDRCWVNDEDDRLKNSYRLIPPDGLADFLQDNIVDEVIICLPLKEYYNQHSAIIDTCVEQGVIVRVLADYFFSQLAHARVEYFEGRSILTLYTGTMGGIPFFIKRVMDVVVSLALLVLLLPVFLIVPILIRLDSPGPAFFVQQRLGLNKRRFSLYKFRTMVRDAEKLQQELEELNEADGPVFKIRNDPRITRIGRFLRTTSIDELPQLFNVLKGDMSLVGPRPLPVRDYEGFDRHWFNRRFSVRPGITCTWQVDGRSDLPFDKWIKLDLQYIDNWSLPLDLRILLKTVPAVLRGRGAA